MANFRFLSYASAFLIYSLSSAEPLQNEDFRLPTNVWPEHYEMQFLVVLDETPGFEQFTAPATSKIRVNCSEAVQVITLHAINLTVNDATLRVTRLQTGEDIPVQLSYQEEFDFLHINLAASTVPYEAYEVLLEFVTPISRDRLNGMYLDQYSDPVSGEVRNIATTLFAPYHTRRAFPCFDEPSFRATYDITLGHHTQYHAMSNAHIIGTTPIENMPNWVWDKFASTPSISSYIIAMIVSDLEYESAPSDSFRNVSVRVYARPEAIDMGAGEYSAQLTADVMTFFETLFIVPYPLTKLYSVALPQFFFNAMENWNEHTSPSTIFLSSYFTFTGKL